MAPVVGGKAFPYTNKGKKAAKLARKKKQMTSDGYMPARVK